MPKSACGLSQPIPSGPCAMTSAGMAASGPKDGRSSVQVQMARPAVMPSAAPVRVAPRQKRPKSIAGSTCATPAKAMSPIAESAAPPPDRRQ